MSRAERQKEAGTLFSPVREIICARGTIYSRRARRRRRGGGNGGDGGNEDRSECVGAKEQRAAPRGGQTRALSASGAPSSPELFRERSPRRTGRRSRHITYIYVQPGEQGREGENKNRLPRTPTCAGKSGRGLSRFRRGREDLRFRSFFCAPFLRACACVRVRLRAVIQPRDKRAQ